MIGELDIAGVFIPAAFFLAIAAFTATTLIKAVLRRLQAYRFIWHAGLFDTALFVVAFYLAARATVDWTPYFRGLN